MAQELVGEMKYSPKMPFVRYVLKLVLVTTVPTGENGLLVTEVVITVMYLLPV